MSDLPGEGNLTALLARVEAAEGPDRELDADLFRAFGDGAVQRGHLGWNWRLNNVGIWTSMPMLTASLDAALALQKRVLPDWHWTIKERVYQTPPIYWATLQCWRDEETAHAASAALALLTAMLKALIAQSRPAESASARLPHLAEGEG